MAIVLSGTQHREIKELQQTGSVKYRDVLEDKLKITSAESMPHFKGHPIRSGSHQRVFLQSRYALAMEVENAPAATQ